MPTVSVFSYFFRGCAHAVRGLARNQKASQPVGRSHHSHQQRLVELTYGLVCWLAELRFPASSALGGDLICKDSP